MGVEVGIGPCPNGNLFGGKTVCCKELSFAPAGLVLLKIFQPTACAVGCVLSPLCGWVPKGLKPRPFKTSNSFGTAKAVP